MRHEILARAATVADEVGTPFYLYDPGAAPRVIAGIRRGMRAWGPGQLAYSVKTNPLGVLLGHVREAGAWAEVVSNDEYRHARTSGFDPGQIVFNGPLKAAGIESEALTAALINADTLEELDVIEHAAARERCPVRVGLRVCPPFTAPSWSRFGLSIEAGEFEQGLAQVRSSRWMQLAGIHAHLGTQVPGRRVYRSSIRLLRELWRDHGLSANVWLDIGGGYAFAHDSAGEGDSWSSFFAELASEWPAGRPFLVVEPGRVVAGPALALVCRVLAHKRRPREPVIVVIDGGTNHNVMGAFFEHAWEFAESDGETVAFRLCGPLCMEDDVMSGERTGALPKRGSLAAMRNAGAYSLALARSFIQPVPPVVQLGNEGAVEVLLPRADYSAAFGTAQSACSPSPSP